MSQVVVVRLAEPTPGTRPTEKQYRSLLEAALGALTRADLRSLFFGHRVGLKVNCVAGRFNSTPTSLTTAVSDLLQDSGLKDHNLLTWDRTSGELKEAGFKLNASSFGRQCYGTDTHPATYGREFYSHGQVSSLVSAILTQEVSASINLAVLKDHSLAGLSAGLKNMYGAIHNPNKYHDHNCDPFVADVNALAPIAKCHRLSIIDAGRVQYQGGPGWAPGHVSDYGGLLVATDPVAADAVGAQIIDHLRQQSGLPSLAESDRPVKYLASAEKYELGQAQLEQVDIVALSVDQNGRATSGSWL